MVIILADCAVRVHGLFTVVHWPFNCQFRVLTGNKTARRRRSDASLLVSVVVDCRRRQALLVVGPAEQSVIILSLYCYTHVVLTRDDGNFRLLLRHL